MIEFALAIIGAIVVFLAVVCLAGLALASLLPRPIVIREREPELVPLVPSVVRKKHADVWVN